MEALLFVLPDAYVATALAISFSSYWESKAFNIGTFTRSIIRLLRRGFVYDFLKGVIRPVVLKARSTVEDAHSIERISSATRMIFLWLGWAVIIDSHIWLAFKCLYRRCTIRLISRNSLTARSLLKLFSSNGILKLS